MYTKKASINGPKKAKMGGRGAGRVGWSGMDRELLKKQC